MKSTVLFIVSLFFFSLALPGCVHRPAPNTDGGPDVSQLAVCEDASMSSAVTVSAVLPLDWMGSGSIAYAQTLTPLTAAQEQLLYGYMHRYYTSLAKLEPLDFSPLFAPEAGSQLKSDQAVLTALVGVRSMQLTDLSLSGYAFYLHVYEIERQEDGDMRLQLTENSLQQFTIFPGVNSENWVVTHRFLLTFVDGAWRIREHRQSGSLPRLIMGLGRWQPSLPMSALDATVDSDRQASLLLALARNDVARRETRGQASPSLHFDHAYDRAAAAAYAREWVNKRNPQWPVYDSMGGNCQNFVSQAISAGGVPMDYTAPGQWKWYSAVPNSAFVPAGRAPAWSGVREFLTYVQNNRGSGLVAWADAPYYSGEIGDIIHMGINDDWRHTVIITAVLKDAEGRTVDYLVASNTSNLRNFPASAFYYTGQMLIKVYGWND